MKNIIIILAFISIVILPVQAQVSSPLSAGDQAAYINFGLDPAVSTTLGYVRGINPGFVNKDLMISSELTLPVANLDLKDYRFKVGIRTSAWNYKGWDVSFPIHFVVKGTENWMHKATGLGADYSGLFGYYGKSWFVNLEIGYNHVFATKITATDRYKEYYYSGFKNGWYKSTASYFTRGIGAGYRFGKTEFSIRAGQSAINWSDDDGDLFPPFYFSIGLSYRL